jgi:hypothetical protein
LDEVIGLVKVMDNKEKSYEEETQKGSGKG